MTCMDKNRYTLPTGEGKTGQQKRHLVKDALINGGAENFDGLPVLRTLGGDAQFPV